MTDPADRAQFPSSPADRARRSHRTWRAVGIAAAVAALAGIGGSALTGCDSASTSVAGSGAVSGSAPASGSAAAMSGSAAVSGSAGSSPAASGTRGAASPARSTSAPHPGGTASGGCPDLAFLKQIAGTAGQTGKLTLHPGGELPADLPSVSPRPDLVCTGVATGTGGGGSGAFLTATYRNMSAAQYERQASGAPGWICADQQGLSGCVNPTAGKHTALLVPHGADLVVIVIATT